MKHLIIFFLLAPLVLFAQKKPLDHSVYDGWQSIGERMISNDGKWVVYTVTPQEGDAELFIHSTDGTNYKKQISRGYNAVITEDNRFVIFRIRPFFKDTRDARVKKKKPEDFPKDSFAVVELGNDNVWKVAKIKSYKTPKKAAGWVAYHQEREPGPAKATGTPTQKTVDSLKKTIDSLVLLVNEIKNKKAGNADEVILFAEDAEDDPAPGAGANEGSDLVLRNLSDGKERLFKNVSEYYFNDYGQKLLMRITRSTRDASGKNGVVIYDIATKALDTIARGGNDFKNFVLTEDGSKVAFVAERDTATKAVQKFYQLYLYNGSDSASVLVDKKSVGMQLGMTVSEHGNVAFSKSGKRLFFGTAPIQPPKDTSLIEVDLVKLDIWHYKDDYLQTQQLFNLQNELKRSYLAVYDFAQNKMEQLATKELPTIIQTNEGDGEIFIAITDTGRRVQRQWGINKSDIYALDVKTGKKTLIKRDHNGLVSASSTGKYVLLYDNKVKHYFAWDGKTLKNITSKIKVPLYNEEYDMPADPNPYGSMRWKENDESVFIYDRYGVWQVDPKGGKNPKLVVDGRKHKTAYRYIQTDPEEKYIKEGQAVYFRLLNQATKKAGIAKGFYKNGLVQLTSLVDPGPFSYATFIKAKINEAFILSKETFETSPDLYYVNGPGSANKLSSLNPHQGQYNWGTAELYKWKTFNGQESLGILYKPEDFDPNKKYPMLIYFYEKVSDGLYNYNSPSPTPSRLNIPFFVSRGYLVFTPDISYTKGNPGKDAYNYIVSGAQSLAKNKWVDGKNIGIQGQSWGGYQVSYLITQTNMFKAAWAGAPVANMTSAYGGIRWESGMNRQFQYEKSQSRIGATLWERPDLYIANSPLFHLTKVQTPLVIMHNDADGAVPWYQGIEMFTAMRRLDKKVWLLNYNGEAHNLVERKNRKDIQIRQQQFFDWLLKGEKPAKWITEGVPAVKKGKDWGLEILSPL